ncbi:hypothetical protein CTAYLR_003021 [Chrysophaeum taylorii]|uniref:histidine kinase n=1 Tax=Chrysophaeum taylorii TaxID=2483200 RepID=A0AAD7U4W3_9STRA|nr:hypothetical protein CTAYLR_003021 [Chrysophaeum taylorii]
MNAEALASMFQEYESLTFGIIFGMPHGIIKPEKVQRVELMERYTKRWKETKHRVRALRATKSDFREWRKQFFRSENFHNAAIANFTLGVISTGVGMVDDKKFARDLYVASLQRVVRKERNALVAAAVASGAVSLFVFFMLAVTFYKSLRADEQCTVAVLSKKDIIDGMGVSCLVVDEHSRVLKANESASEAFGGDLVGEFLDKALPNSRVETLGRGVQVKGRTSGGEKLELVAYKTETVDVDGIRKYYVVLNDITELVGKTSELEIQQRVLAQFAHELRNKYAPAVSVLQHLSENKSSEYLPALALLQEADQLIATRLNIFKIMKGNYTSVVECLDIGEAMRQRVAAAAALNTERDVEFRAVGDLWAKLDAYIFTHISNNLLSNARKATTSGFVELRFVEANRDEQLVFAVADSGRGVVDSIKNRIFQEQVATCDQRGVGLGLESCRTFARAIGGNTWLERTTVCSLGAAGGTEFRFSLPGQIVSPPQKHTSNDISDGALFPNLTCHIVEDSNLLRKSLVAKLKAATRKLGAEECDFKEYDTVEAILPHIHDINQPHSIVTVDQNMDAMGGQLQGTDLVRALVQAGYEGLIISASGDDASAQDHVDLGAHLRFNKPFPTTQAIAQHLRHAYDPENTSWRAT